MKAWRPNPKVKNFSESGKFNTAFELLQRLQQRYYTVNDITKTAHMLLYYALKQKKSESGIEFVDRNVNRCGSVRTTQPYLAYKLTTIQLVSKGNNLSMQCTEKCLSSRVQVVRPFMCPTLEL